MRPHTSLPPTRPTRGGRGAGAPSPEGLYGSNCQVQTMSPKQIVWKLRHVQMCRQAQPGSVGRLPLS